MMRCVVVLCTLVCWSQSFAQGSREDYARADRLPGDWSGMVRNADIGVRWLDAETPVYRYELEDGSSEWRTVDLTTGEVRPAFDMSHVAEALAGRGVEQPAEVAWFDFIDARLVFMLNGDARIWAWEDGRLTRIAHDDLPDSLGLEPDASDRTRSGGPATTLFIVNATDQIIELFWLDHGGNARSYGVIEPGMTKRQGTFAGHSWRVVTEEGTSLGVYTPGEEPGIIFARPVASEPSVPETKPVPGTSPDGTRRVIFRDHNVVLRTLADGSEDILTEDGTPEDSYGSPVRWSPNGARFVVMRTVPGSDRTVTAVDSSPDDRLQPEVIEFRYRKPGDAVDLQRPALFDATMNAQMPLDQSPIENPWSVSRVRWAADSGSFTYLYNARGHQTMRYVRVDAKNGQAEIIIDERAETFIDWTNKVYIHELGSSDEVVWMSERSGWNHLYLIDARTGRVKNPITSGEWVVRSVERVDADSRRVFLRVMGVIADQDPYHVHHASVDLDGSNFTLLTEGDGTHRISYSPDKRHLIDVWSRVDLAPITEIRRASDGVRVAVLAEGDLSGLVAEGWEPPERFVAKGRDGLTDIWGFIQRPTNFDPARTYPVVESIYAGPHGHHVPKSFSVWRGSRSLSELGFVTVHVDGMGTNWRSKAFQDVAFKNLKDAGFLDRIAWMRSAAEARPWMDLDRVGIYGVSAGGQSALGAMLFHGDFYKAAVADCGCHDNRMDKIWWNEQWMGWPVDDSYAASSNVEHAGNLAGDLLLAVGELDQNVDPASTMQVVDALIKADKDFELIVFPGLGHGTIESPYGRRRLHDFFVRSLLDVEPRWTESD